MDVILVELIDKPDYERLLMDASHCKEHPSCIDQSVTVIKENGSLVPGTWQGIYFCEFDGPRTRNYHVKVVE